MYSIIPAPPSGAWGSPCLCAPFRALGPAQTVIQATSPLTPRLVRRVMSAPALSRKSPPHPKGTSSALRASQRTINSKRKRETTTILSWRPLHNRPAGVLRRVPRSVGNRSTDIVSNIDLSTTLLQKFGVLRGGAPKPGFAYFCLAAKVGRARGHEMSPPRSGGHPRLWQGARFLLLLAPVVLAGRRLDGAVFQPGMHAVPRIQRHIALVSDSNIVPPKIPAAFAGLCFFHKAHLQFNNTI